MKLIQRMMVAIVMVLAAPGGVALAQSPEKPEVVQAVEALLTKAEKGGFEEPWQKELDAAFVPEPPAEKLTAVLDLLDAKRQGLASYGGQAVALKLMQMKGLADADARRIAVWVRAGMKTLGPSSAPALAALVLLDARTPEVDRQAIFDAMPDPSGVELKSVDGRYIAGEVVQVKLLSARNSELSRVLAYTLSSSAPKVEMRGAMRTRGSMVDGWIASPIAWARMPDKPGDVTLTLKVTTALTVDRCKSMLAESWPIAVVPPSKIATTLPMQRTKSFAVTVTLAAGDVPEAALVGDATAERRLQQWVWPNSGKEFETTRPATDSPTVWVKAQVVPAAGWLIVRKDGKELGRGWLVIDQPDRQRKFSLLETSVPAAAASEGTEWWFEPDPQWMRRNRWFSTLYSGPGWQVYRRKDAKWPVPASDWPYPAVAPER